MELEGKNNNSNSNSNSNHNDVSVTPLTCTQTLDQIHYNNHHQQQTRSLVDRVTVPAPIPVGSNPKPPVLYRECLKNHAASVGGSIYDGCGEFMPSGEEGSIEALKCAACNCHRNFHRKATVGVGGVRVNATTSLVISHHHNNHHQRYVNVHASPSSAMATPMSVAYASGGGGGGGGGGNESSSEDLNVFGHYDGSSGGGGMGIPPQPFSMSKKRFRTKFTGEQKEKMSDFAAKLGWRMNKQDEEEIDRFCQDIGLKRQVFKVWMHNNKSNVAKRQDDV